jgi:hypothetical protein
VEAVIEAGGMRRLIRRRKGRSLQDRRPAFGGGWWADTVCS